MTAGLAIYDTMQYVRCPVSTVCIGQAASMGSLLLAAGAKGKRFALPNSRIMIHQPSGGAQGQATDIEIQAREILTLRARLNEIYVQHTGQPIEAIAAAVERDKFLSPSEAKEFGLIDEVVKTRPTREESRGPKPEPLASLTRIRPITYPLPGENARRGSAPPAVAPGREHIYWSVTRSVALLPGPGGRGQGLPPWLPARYRVTECA